jgi:hypothetical protein
MTYPDDDGPIAELPALDAQAGPARRMASARAHDLVQAALAAASAAHEAPSLADPSVRPRPARRSRAARLIAIALAATLVAAVAMAGAALVARLRAPAVSPAPPPAAPSADMPAAATSAEDPAAVPPPPDPSPAPPAAPEESASASASAAPSASIARPPAHEVRPKDLLEIANQLRAQKRWREAEAAYARVARDFPGTSEAYTATIAAAELRLDHLKDAKGAEALYKSAQSSRPDGALSEEADFGVAESHRAAGNAVAEAGALRAFLAKHPTSPLRPKVEARLAALAAAKKP